MPSDGNYSFSEDEAQGMEDVATERLCESEDRLMARIVAILSDHRDPDYTDIANMVSAAISDHMKTHGRLPASGIDDEWADYQAAVVNDREVQDRLDAAAEARGVGVPERIAVYRNAVGHCVVCNRECLWHTKTGEVIHPACHWKRERAQ